jgi:fumarylpyruvate hydrolase
MPTIFPAPPTPTLAVRGTDARFPVHRIYCIGRNFADHAKEMGATVDRGNPVFFMKPADAVVVGGGDVAYPPGTRDLHHEVELVVALGADADGATAVAEAMALVFGYGVGLDLTRRDLQAAAKAKGLPWDTGKGFDQSAPVGEIVPVAAAGELASRRLALHVNGELRQQSTLDQMVFDVAEVLHELSKLYALKAGDLVFMGPPAGVAALQRGDTFEASIDGLTALSGRIV